MRRLSTDRAQWRQAEVDPESVAVPNRCSKRVTPHRPRERSPVSWKCGMSFSPSFSINWLKSKQGQPQIFAANCRLLTIVPETDYRFPRNMVCLYRLHFL